MTKERVNDLLEHYRENKARLTHLRRECQELKAAIEQEQHSAIETEAVHAQQYSGMPHAGAINRSVEETALRYADGYQSPMLRDWLCDLASIESEIRVLDNAVGYVDDWFFALEARERTVMENHTPIGLLSWREMTVESKRLLGEYMSISGLRNIGDAAKRKIYAIACR